MTWQEKERKSLLETKLVNPFSRYTAGQLLDSAGVMVSWLCVLHCLALPFVLALLPLAGLSFLIDETVELAILGIAVCIAALSLVPAYFRQHGSLRAIALFAAGIGLFGISRSLFEDDLPMEIIFVLVGAVLITTAHLINRRLCKQCAECRAKESV